MFNKDITRLADFTTGTGNTVQVPMMSEDGAYSVKNQVPGLNARVLELPYKGDRFSLFIILPNSWDGVPQLESLLTSEVILEMFFFLNQILRQVLSMFQLLY